MAQETYSRQNTEGAADISAKAGLLITCDMDEVLNYAIIHNGGNILRDEDAQINITLCEFLKQNFDLRISGLNPPPADEHGLDIPRIFAQEKTVPAVLDNRVV